MKTDQPLVLRDNETCCYCRCELTAETATKEHVIARRFVPTGTLDRSWNLIARACRSCNNVKGDLEDDLAVLTLQYSASSAGNDERAQLVRDTLSKACRTISRRTRRPVAHSSEETKLNLPFASLNMSVELVSPPQVSDERAHQLALMQTEAFFYGLTYDPAKRRGHLWPGGGFFPLDVQPPSDWGNPVQRWFMRAVRNWQPRLMVSVAQGFVRVAIRRHPGKVLWSCAIEWNEGLRLIAVFGEQNAALAFAADMPPLYEATDLAIRYPDHVMRWHTEIALPDEDDLLFEYDEAVAS